MKTRIALKKRNAIVISDTGFTDPSSKALVYTLQAEMMNLGYIMSQDLISKLQKKTVSYIKSIAAEIITFLKEEKGDNVIHKPMYKNFPQEVIDMSRLELFINAISHYWTGGQWMPESEAISREFTFESSKFRTINAISDDEFMEIFTQMLSSNISLSELDTAIVEWYFDSYPSIGMHIPDSIPFKENMCIVASKIYDTEDNIGYIPLKTATDILRFAVYRSGGDVSLAEQTKFKSMPRKLRRFMVNKLEKFAKKNSNQLEEDIARHKNRWVRLFHSLHVSEYKYARNLNKIVSKLRSGQSLTTTRSIIEKALNPIGATNTVKTASIANAAIAKFFSNMDTVIDNKVDNEVSFDQLLSVLKTRPGEFARRMDKILRTYTNEDQTKILNGFDEVTDQVSTRVLLQLLGRLQERVAHNGGENPTRVVFPKGNVAKAQIIPTTGTQLDTGTLEILGKNIVKTLSNRMLDQKSLGKMYIDDRLINCPVPMAQRDASTALRQLQRGTRLPFDDSRLVDGGKKDYFRFFVYWTGQDIDLSASFHDENFKMIDQVSYTNMRSGEGKNVMAVHSGDITSAPNGASEFIDININKARKKGRYVVLNLYVFSGPNFGDHSEAFAGYMALDYPGKNNIWQPRNVEYKIDLTGASKNSIPLVFDLETREVIFTDLYTNSRGDWGGNNVHSNKANIRDVIRSITQIENKVSMQTLAMIHSSRATEIVDNPNDADTVFSIETKPEDFDGTWITPYDINTISSEYLA